MRVQTRAIPTKIGSHHPATIDDRVDFRSKSVSDGRRVAVGVHRSDGVVPDARNTTKVLNEPSGGRAVRAQKASKSQKTGG